MPIYKSNLMTIDLIGTARTSPCHSSRDYTLELTQQLGNFGFLKLRRSVSRPFANFRLTR